VKLDAIERRVGVEGNPEGEMSRFMCPEGHERAAEKACRRSSRFLSLCTIRRSSLVSVGRLRARADRAKQHNTWD
jgi:hypothetical protein